MCLEFEINNGMQILYEWAQNQMRVHITSIIINPLSAIPYINEAWILSRMFPYMHINWLYYAVGLVLNVQLFVNYSSYVDGILPDGPYTPGLRMADRALLAGYPRCIIDAW